MQFIFVVSVYMMVIGQPPQGDPVKFKGRQVFTSLEECQAWPKTVDGATQYSALMNAIASHVPEGHAATATSACEPDGSI